MRFVLVVLSADALRSDWSRKEVELAMRDPRYAEHGRIVPLLAKPCDWQTLHPQIKRFQLVDFTADREEAILRLLHFWQIDRYVFPQFKVGDVLLPVHRFRGDDGKTRFYPPDGVSANVPTASLRRDPVLSSSQCDELYSFAFTVRQATLHPAKGYRWVNVEPLRNLSEFEHVAGGDFIGKTRRDDI